MKNSGKSRLTIAIALVSLIVSILAAVKYYALKEQVRIKGDQLEALEKELAGLNQLMGSRIKALEKATSERDSITVLRKQPLND